MYGLGYRNSSGYARGLYKKQIKPLTVYDNRKGYAGYDFDGGLIKPRSENYHVLMFFRVQGNFSKTR
jgi:hypothetical protein